MNRIVIFGATSAIAQACAKQLVHDQARFFLVGRNAERLQTVASDLQVRGAASAEIAALDLNACDQHEAVIARAGQVLGGFDLALIAHGTLPDQDKAIENYPNTREAFDTNCLSALSLLTILGNEFEKQQSGSLVAISSVAGDRGRQSNYVYGAAKAAVSTFMQGLRNRLHAKGVQVLTVKPGFVDTPMTADFDKGALWSTPEKVAQDIVKAVAKNKRVIYTPFFWRYIMLVIRCLPEALFVRLKL